VQGKLGTSHVAAAVRAIAAKAGFNLSTLDTSALQAVLASGEWQEDRFAPQGVVS
jgi:hypothetical protein